ncbi:MAG: helix-turn-helix domain-containing protein [Bacillota bacterium]
MNESNPSYFAILPANVRYDKNIKASAKLLFAEISALCNKNGTCFASNKYFADLYGVDNRSIQRWLTSLSDNNYIIIDNNSSENSTRRIIYLVTPNGGQKCHTPMTNLSYPHDKNVTHNNNINNNINNKESIYHSSKEVDTSDRLIDSDDFTSEGDVNNHELEFYKEIVNVELEKGVCKHVEFMRNIIAEIVSKEFWYVNGNKVRSADYLKELSVILRISDCNYQINEVLETVDMQKGIKNKLGYVISSLYNKCKQISLENSQSAGKW